MDKKEIKRGIIVGIIAAWLLFFQYSLWDIGIENMMLCSRITTLLIFVYFYFEVGKNIRRFMILAVSIALFNLISDVHLLFMSEFEKGNTYIIIICILWSIYILHNKRFRKPV